MIQEAYCSFEVAKLLNEKGFEAYTHLVYKLPSQLFRTDKERLVRNNNDITKGDCIEILAPTHQMAMAWMREIYGIDIVIEISDPSVKDRKYYCVIWNKNNDSYILDLFNFYEEAVEAALKYSLKNLI